MAQQTEYLYGYDGVTEIASVTADSVMKGVAISTIGVWYDRIQIQQFKAMLVRAQSFLSANP
jgi:hypothetical protein